MKKGMITLLAILWTFSLANAQTVTLTFTGRDAGSQHVQLNRVCVTNLTRGWQETIYWPDTTLSMQNSTGISENGLGEGFSLAQNVPNPFSGETEVFMATDETGDVFLTISDVTGKSVAVFSRMMEPGGHHFRIRLSDAQTYILTARQGARSASIKMVNKGTSESNEILYEGNGNPISYTLKSSTTHPFTFGDQMEYVGYAVINGNEEESQRITQAQGASQTFVMQFQGLQHRLPTVITSAVTEITENSALCGGTVTDEGSNAVTGRGVCWGTSHNPTINDSLTAEGSGIGSFTSNITELESSTTYYVRAYATNDVGTAYGQEIAFTTVDEILPSVTGNITYNQYTCVHIAGSVDYEGSSPVLEKGVCWSTSPNPTIADNYMSFGGGVGSYSCSITDLNPETRYYFSVYARNNAGITCGPVNGGGYNGSVTTGYYPTPYFYFDNISNPTVIDESTMQISFDVTWYPTNYCRDSIVEKGFCWTTSNSHYDQSPTLSDNYISLGAGEGSVAYTMTGLTPNVYYHFRPYAITTAGVTFYGSTFFKKIILHTPQVSTASVSDITDISAVCGGNVTGTGTNQFDAVVTARGVCWSTSPNPTIADSHTVDGSGIGVFTSTMTGLSPNTQYYVRAYATNGVGTGYGNEVNFTTASSVILPSVTTSPVLNITEHAASCGGNVISDGGTTVTGRGVCWSTSHNPTIVDNHTYGGSGTGNFDCIISGLASGTTYYARAFAINNIGVAYGGELEFTTLQVQSCPNIPTVTDYDGNTYNTVQIGNQCWMKENLRTTHYADGTAITLAQGSGSSNTIPFYCTDYNGYHYYNWPAAKGWGSDGVNSICPEGWHVPSAEEWLLLIQYVKSQSQYACDNNYAYIAKSLASASGWSNCADYCAVGNNKIFNNGTGFSAMPAETCGSNQGAYARFWSTTGAIGTTSLANAMVMEYDNPTVYTTSCDRSHSLSIRCLRDGTSSAGLPTVITNSMSDISETTATCGGNIVSDGGTPVTSRGVCWSTSPNPTINDFHTNDGIGIGSFISNITGLTHGTTYYARAYATNANGTSYGAEVTFTTSITCGVHTVSDYDGNEYNTVQIGDQCWMKENMRTTHFADGRTIAQATVSQYSSSVPHYYNPGFDTEYGFFYNWIAMTYATSTSGWDPSGVRQGVCPMGWHVPSDSEWTELTQYVGSQSQYRCGNNNTYIAKALASTTGWDFHVTNTCYVGYLQSGNNATGFSALPAGLYMHMGSTFFNSSYYAYFWSATENSSTLGINWYLAYFSPNIQSNTCAKKNACPVRCLRD